MDVDQTISLNNTQGKLGVTKAKHLLEEENNTWHNFNAKMRKLWNILQELQDLTYEFLMAIAQAENITTNN